jgi:hypothetical protein
MANNRIVHFEIPANRPEALTSFGRALPRTVAVSS